MPIGTDIFIIGLLVVGAERGLSCGRLNFFFSKKKKGGSHNVSGLTGFIFNANYSNELISF